MPEWQSRQPVSAWRKSSHSKPEGECIEIGCGHSSVLVRDSRSRTGVMLSFQSDQWTAFVGSILAGS